MAHVYFILHRLRERWYIMFISSEYKGHTDGTVELALPRVLLCWLGARQTLQGQT